MKILLVDDEVEFVSTLAERLSMRGYDTTWTSTGAQALELIRSNRFDVAVLDVKMPGVGGLELRDSMEKQCGGMSFVFVTGHGSKADFNQGRECGAHYLGKPIDIKELIAILDDVSNNPTA